MVISVSWFAASSRVRGMRLGTAASLAGIHSRVIDSIRNVAISAQPTTSPPAAPVSAYSGIEANSTKRSRSQMTIVHRRSNRSAKTPATGPSTSAGSSRIAVTPPNAAPWAVLPETWEAANSAVASRPSQSPKEAALSTIHSLRNGRMRSTERMAARPEWSAAVPGDDTPGDSPLFWLSMAVPPRAGPGLGIPGGTL